MKNQNFTKSAFTDSVKNAQEQYGSRRGNARMEHSGDRFILTQKEEDLIRSRDMFYLATVGQNGWPYIQFRGGPKGFLRILDDHTLGMADYRGNRQYISVGNMRATPKATLFLIDYPGRQRLKIWTETEVIDLEERPELLETLYDADYRAVAERIILFQIKAYDWNCPQHITPRHTPEQIREILGERDSAHLTDLF
jgi:hypothetical protein